MFIRFTMVSFLPTTVSTPLTSSSPLIIFVLFCFSFLHRFEAIPLPYHSVHQSIGSFDLFPTEVTALSTHQALSTSSTDSSSSNSSATDSFHFSYVNHPVFNDLYFLHSSVSPPPVVISRYYRYVPSIQSRRNDEILFAVGVALYHTSPSPKHNPIQATTTVATGSAPFPQIFQSLDALVVSAFGAPPSKSSPNRGGVEAQLRSAGRVFVLLYGNGMQMDEAEVLPGSIKITGMSSEWKISDAKVMHMTSQSP